eukprot:356096-Chlamydomonas_euryale.AAC.2
MFVFGGHAHTSVRVPTRTCASECVQGQKRRVAARQLDEFHNVSPRATFFSTPCPHSISPSICPHIHAQPQHEGMSYFWSPHLPYLRARKPRAERLSGRAAGGGRWPGRAGANGRQLPHSVRAAVGVAAGYQQDRPAGCAAGAGGAAGAWSCACVR